MDHPEVLLGFNPENEPHGSSLFAPFFDAVIEASKLYSRKEIEDANSDQTGTLNNK